MLALHDLAEDWQAVRNAADGWELPSVRPAWVRSAPRQDGADPLDEVDRALNEGRGWARFQSASCDGRLWSPEREGRGRLLRAEWVDFENDKVSFRLAPGDSGAEVPRVLRQEEAAQAHTGEGWHEVLAEERRLVGHQKGRALRYAVYWAAGGKSGAEVNCLFARFLGFTAPAAP